MCKIREKQVHVDGKPDNVRPCGNDKNRSPRQRKKKQTKKQLDGYCC